MAENNSCPLGEDPEEKGITRRHLLRRIWWGAGVNHAEAVIYPAVTWAIEPPLLGKTVLARVLGHPGDDTAKVRTLAVHGQNSPL